MASVDRPHFGYPFARGHYVEQDTEEHVIACENVIVRCPTGFRLERPEFGWSFPIFSNAPLNLQPLEEALRKFEPRGRADATEYASAASDAVRIIQTDVGVSDG